MERIKTSDGFRATIKWKGNLVDNKGNEDLFYGVEWDDPTRGKHSGEYKNQKLFEVSIPNSGSFLRSTSVNKGEKLSDLIHEKNVINFSLNFDNSNVESVGEINDFPEGVKYLNFANTLIGSYKFIWDILNLSNNIECLILGRNHFVETVECDKIYNLKEIVLNDTNIKNESLSILLKSLPNLESIDVTATKVTDFSIFGKLRNLKSITASHMHFENFDHIIKYFGDIESLESLNLNHNSIKTITDPKGCFKNLKLLSVNNNLIHDISDLDGLTGFKELYEFRNARNKIQENLGEVNARLFCIARFPHIKKLNGSDINNNERREAEILYLSKYAEDVHRNGKTNHPRWDELVEKYDPPALSSEVKQQSKNIRVKLDYEGNIREETLLLTQTVESVSELCKTLFFIDEDIELVLQYEEYITKLTYYDQTLSDVGCQDGATLYIKHEGEADEMLAKINMGKSFRIRARAAISRGDI